VRTTAVILAGGRGTRSADPGTPKIAQRIDDRPLLQWHLDLLAESSIGEVLIVTGHLGDEVALLVDAADTHNLSVRILHEEKPAGTVPALRLAADHTDAGAFLVILGDVWASFPVDSFLRAWQRSGKDVAAIVHPSLHPHDSDAVIPQSDGTVNVVSKKQRNEDASRVLIRNMSATGVFALNRTAAQHSGDATDIGSDLLAQAAARHALFVFISSHYFKDTGTPDRLDKARQEWNSGTFARRGSLSPRAGLILDRDGVINPALPEVYEPGSMTLLPGVAAQIANANALGIPVLVATNQPGLAKGFMTEADHEAIRAQLDELLIAEGAFVDDYAYCPHHPESGFPGEVSELKVLCACRKPEPGMLLHLISHHALDPSLSLMVGDSERDQGAAQAAGVRFSRVTDQLPAAAVIGAAVKELAC